MQGSCSLRFLGLAILLLTPFSAPADDRMSSLWVLLSDNNGSPGPQWPTGCTYTYDKAPTNPGDANGRRLLDGDRPYADWNTCVGHNWEDLAVTFDLQGLRRLARVRVSMPLPQRPRAVEVAARGKPEDKWHDVAKIEPSAESGSPGWFELPLSTLEPARQVRLTFRLKEWGFYIREVELWGLPDDGTVAPASGTIVVGNSPGAKSVAAAYDLKLHLERMTGQTWPIVQGAPPKSGRCLLVGPEAARAAGEDVPQGPWPASEEILLQSKGDWLIVAGNDAGAYQGTAFAATLLLEKLGCGWYGPDPLWQVIPRHKDLEFPSLNIRQRPSLAFRQMWYSPGQLPMRWLQGGPTIAAGHAHDAICPPAEYFQTHPEYFALVGGRRKGEGEWQLCTSHADVIRITAEKARTWFAQSPGNAAFSLSNNDCGGFCECPECARTGATLGARMLTYANAVQREIAQTHPGRKVCFLAYWYTFGAPPAGARAEPGVIVMVVNQACHAHALDDPACEANAGWCRNFEGWCATGAEMAIYEWYIPGCSSPAGKRTPWISGDTATRNLRYWARHGAKYVTYESQPAYEQSPGEAHPGYPLRWPLFFPAARMMWDLDLTAERLLDDACTKLYGPAATAMRGYYHLLQQSLEETTTHSGTWGLPPPADYLTPKIIAQANALLDAAQTAGQGAGPDIVNRIAEERALWDRAAKTVAVLRESGGDPIKVWVNGALFLVAEKQGTGKWIRELGGIGPQFNIVLRPGTGPDQPVADSQTIELRSGIKFFSVPAASAP